MVAPIFGTIGYYVIMITIACLVITGIFMLAKAKPCLACPVNAFERFENPPNSEFGRRAAEITNGMKQLDTAMETFQEDVNDVCTISAFVEDGYVGSKEQSDESEYKLPPDVQKKNAEKRKTQATNIFRSMRKSQMKGAVLECFSTSDANVLIEKNKEFKLYQTRDPYKKIFTDGLITTIQSALVFNKSYLEKGMKSANDATEHAKKNKKEGFENEEEKAAQLAMSESANILATISNNLKDLAALRPIIKQHKDAIRAMKNKQKSVESGNEAAKQLDEENEKPKKINTNIYT